MSRSLLVMIPVPPEEAKARMIRARKDAKAAQKKANAGRQFIASNTRMADTVAKLDADAYLNERIAAGCKQALDDAEASPDELLDPDPSSELAAMTHDEAFGDGVAAGVDEEGG